MGADLAAGNVVHLNHIGVGKGKDRRVVELESVRWRVIGVYETRPSNDAEAPDFVWCWDPHPSTGR